MKKRLADNGINYLSVVNTYKKQGEEETNRLLLEGENGKPKIIKSSKIIKSIMDHLQSLS